MKTYNILFLCTHNSARSILGEAVASTHPSGRFVGYSAGSTPSGKIQPLAQKIASELGYDVSKLVSKSWDVFAGSDAPQMDFIITVCDDAAGEVCPFWPGRPASAHWGFADPSRVTGSDADREAAYRSVAEGIRQRLDELARLPDSEMNSQTLQALHSK